MSLHTVFHQGPHKPSTLKSHRGRAATGSSCPDLYNPVACQTSLSERGFSRQEYWSVLANTGCHTLLEHLFPAALAANSPEYLVLPEPLRPKQLHHLHIWPSLGKPKSSREFSRANPSGRPTCRGGNKPTIETQGQCGQGRRPKIFPPAVQATD